MATKILGWILLLAGVIIIVWTLYSSYNVFTGKVVAPEIFKIEEKKEALLPKEGEVQAMMEKMLGEQLRAMIPADTVPKILNLAVWAMLASILILGGAQISNLGIKLIKK